MSPRFWNDAAVRRLPLPHRLVALYLITSRQTNRIGCYVLSVAQAAETIGTDDDWFRAALDRVCQGLGWRWDPEARVLYVPTWWRYNDPRNTNTLKGALKDLDDLPPSPLIAQFATNVAHLWGPCARSLTRLIAAHYGHLLKQSQALADAPPDSVPNQTLFGPEPNPDSVPDQTRSGSEPNPGLDANPVAGAVAGTGAGLLAPGIAPPSSLDDADAKPSVNGFPDLGDDGERTTLAWIETGLWTIQDRADPKAQAHLAATMPPLIRDFGDAFVAAIVRTYDGWRRDKGKTRCQRRKRHDRSIDRWARQEAEKRRARGEPLDAGGAPAPTDPAQANAVRKLEREMGRD
ncbi:MAG: hypothetical protein ACE5Q3_11945 [Alphaproteobacteria bacterium]